MSDLGKAIAPDTFQIERTLHAAPERVWSYLVDADKRSRWFNAGDTLTREGQTFEFHFGHHRITDEKPPARWAHMDGSKPDMVMTGRVLAFDPPRTLTITWGGDNASEVTFALAPQGDATVLTITHAKIAKRGDLLDFAGGWTAHLDALEHVVAGEKPHGFWASILRYQAAYQQAVPGGDA